MSVYSPSVFPLALQIGEDSRGLTKRELFAAMAMQGFAAEWWHEVDQPSDYAKISVEMADALIAELNKNA